MGKNKSEGGPCDGCERNRSCEFVEVLTKPKSTIDTRNIFLTLQGLKAQRGCALGEAAKESTPNDISPILETLANVHGIIATNPISAKARINFEKQTSVAAKSKTESKDTPLILKLDFTGKDGKALMQKLLNLSSGNTVYNVAKHFRSS